MNDFDHHPTSRLEGTDPGGTSSRPPSRERILRAALDEFAEHGFAGARVDRIAKAAGVNKAMLYYHYGSKDALYEKVVGGRIVEILSALGQKLTGVDDLEVILGNLAETYATVFGVDQQVRRLMLRELAFPRGQTLEKIGGILRESGFPSVVVGVLQKGMREGRFRVLDPRQVLISFVAMNIGYFLIAPVINRVLEIEDKEGFIEERKKAVVDILMNGVKER
jgi:TetR/AcrR family transcriptional regulator